MAWNEPGGNNSNNQDPWGNRKNDNKGGGRQGPPDLDEAVRKLQENLNKFLGGGKKSGGGGNKGSGGGFSVILLALVVLGAFWLYSAIYQVDEQEQAVILRFGKYHQTVGPGLNIYFPPIERKFQHNVTRERAYSRQGPMLTEDENIIEVPLTVQYKISNLQDYVLQVDGPESACSMRRKRLASPGLLLYGSGLTRGVRDGAEVRRSAAFSGSVPHRYCRDTGERTERTTTTGSTRSL